MKKIKGVESDLIFLQFQLAHPILKALENTPEKWVVDVLYAFNSGDLNKFKQYDEQMSGWDDIRQHKDFLIAKIQLLSLMEVWIILFINLI